jgi:hypothetical protein
VVEADVCGFFDHLDHSEREGRLRERIDDGAFMGLIRPWLKAGVLEADGTVIQPEIGAPQGGMVSPILANVDLHQVLDTWFEQVVKPHCRGEARLGRYADDGVCAFRFQDDAERFYRVRPKRLERFGLQVALEKTRLLRFRRFHPSRKRRFAFLGFERYGLKDRQGIARVKRRTAPKTLQAACRRVEDWIREHRHLPGREFLRGLNLRLRGHYQYFGVRGNSRALYRFFDWAKACIFKWRNRRGGKRHSFTWEEFTHALKQVAIARPCITEVERRRVFA